jgi:hypothetical protein
MKKRFIFIRQIFFKTFLYIKRYVQKSKGRKASAPPVVSVIVFMAGASCLVFSSTTIISGSLAFSYHFGGFERGSIVTSILFSWKKTSNYSTIPPSA